ncbi:MAG TPA: prolyl oligopeptidase family serine peptidase [Symbiobacteriaceae bacterium]|nr:prolyl oligopeptidase family serine peptidase [Symbiobacteriaceae bacterium]
MERPIITERTELAGIPVLHVRARALAGPAPTILYFHGWSAKKEVNIIPAEALAVEGFRVLIPDQIHHGERGTLDYPSSAKTHFWKVILNSIEEAGALRDAAVALGWSEPDRFGVSGHSMGCFVTPGVLARYDWAKVAVLQNGCPCYTWAEAFYRESRGAFPASPTLLSRLTACDPEQMISRIAPRPVLMMHGASDASVPIGGVKRFRELAAPAYAACPDRLELVVIDRLNHFVTKDMIELMRNWFVKWL